MIIAFEKLRIVFFKLEETAWTCTCNPIKGSPLQTGVFNYIQFVSVVPMLSIDLSSRRLQRHVLTTITTLAY
jgi:hypothetical protein